jgi:iron(III) transport system permease protein
MSNTLLLTICVSVGAVVLGTLIAILVVKTDVIGKRFWEWMLLLPISIPPYIGALSYLIFFGSQSTFTKLTHVNIDIYSTPAVIGIFIGFMYPYVYLVVRGSLLRIHELEFSHLTSSLRMLKLWDFDQDTFVWL